MPIYMDLHIVPGVTAKDVAEAHKLDVYLEKDHSCKCMTYWVDELRGHVFCLIDAPSKEKVTELHNKAHGLTPHKIIEVQPNLVESFLGRISDPEEAELTDTGLKLINEPSFRIILATKMNDPVLLQHQLGLEKATELIRQLNTLIRNEIAQHNGVEAEHAGSDFVVSFTSAAKAIACSCAIQQKINDTDLQQAGLRMSIHAGEAVSTNEQLFGETIQLAERLCFIGKPAQVSITSTVKELVSKDLLASNENNLYTLSANDQNLLDLLFTALDKNYSEQDFNMDEYGSSVAMSQSQLYRKTMALCDLSPNNLLKEYRLEKARELMKKKNQNITEITFNSGFNSPSYFTKCFKKKYGILPMAYLDLIN
ncbi:nickel-binding protein [Lacibacter sp.]|uniref:nickel-binding protein n=1 Tax=Lacibacter sp. TaxID=1915409 RepID=UPI002B4B8A43|nr:nickel-binding protein [Lacibacter sp.]HLP39692.1 nickel-binding protein [Lacibacter sp.]